MVISHGGQSLDISAAAQGCLSSTPIGVFPPQNIPYPGTKYCFDENIFFGCEAKELLVKMLRSPNCIDGCKLVSKRPKSNSSIFRKGTWTFVCSHDEFIHNDMNSYQRVVYYMNSYLIMNSYSLRYEFIHVDLNSY